MVDPSERRCTKSLTRIIPLEEAFLFFPFSEMKLEVSTTSAAAAAQTSTIHQEISSGNGRRKPEQAGWVWVLGSFNELTKKILKKCFCFKPHQQLRPLQDFGQLLQRYVTSDKKKNNRNRILFMDSPWEWGVCVSILIIAPATLSWQFPTHFCCSGLDKNIAMSSNFRLRSQILHIKARHEVTVTQIWLLWEVCLISACFL